jgi:thiol-disulfide isomerase/thioredoxin
MRPLRALAVLVALQAALVGVYLAVESGRTAPAPFAVERLDEPPGELSAERGGVAVAAPEGAYLVHFWATWCAPCRTELPALLAAAESSRVPVLAVTDEPWPVVERYFGDDVPDGIVRDPTGRAAAAWRVSGLPDTFVVRGGRVVGRMGGPREWQSDEGRAFLRELGRTR